VLFLPAVFFLKGKERKNSMVNMIVHVTANSIRAKEIVAERKIKQEKELQFRDWETKILRMSGTFKKSLK
jgi:hypothetical protein